MSVLVLLEGLVQGGAKLGGFGTRRNTPKCRNVSQSLGAPRNQTARPEKEPEWGSGIRKSRMSIIFPPVIPGPEMAAPILWAPGIFWLFLLEHPHAHKIPLF